MLVDETPAIVENSVVAALKIKCTSNCEIKFSGQIFLKESNFDYQKLDSLYRNKNCTKL